MKSNKLLSLYLIIILIVFSVFSPMAIADEVDDIPPLTLPPTDPNPNSQIDVFERLEYEKQEGYLKDRVEIIEDSYYFTTKQGFDYI